MKKIYKEQKAAFKRSVVIKRKQEREKVTLYSKAFRNSKFEPRT